MKPITIRMLWMTSALVGLAGLGGPLAAHDTPGIEHSHAFEQTGYGTVRQGHTVNNRLGSITIWSAKPYSGYPAQPPVKFARPEPIRKAPGLPQIGPARNLQPAPEYGKPKRD
ncbi:MAG: hypothetical protein P8Y54_07225 [Xanthomonadales bacterium]